MTGLEILLKVLPILPWAIAALIAVLVFLERFHKPIAEAIGRIRGIGLKGVQLQEQKAPDEAQASLEDRMRVLENPLVAERKVAIERDLQSRNIVNADDREKLLIQSLADAQLLLLFETTYRLIYGSQIFILENLNTQWQGVPKDKPKEIYDFKAKAHPEIYGDYPYERYLTFLIDSGLVEVRDEQLFITTFGRGFLQYMTLTKKPKWKAY